MNGATQSVNEAAVVVNVESQKQRRNITKDIVEFVLTRKDVFTIYDVYQQFPGKESAVQMVIAVVGLAGLLQKIKRAEYRVATDKIDSSLIEENMAARQEIELLRKQNVGLSTDLAQILDEIDFIRQENISNSQARLQIQRLEAENARLKQENEALKAGQPRMRAV